MALIYCPECGRKISQQAQSCPNCGMKLDRCDPELLKDRGDRGRHGRSKTTLAAAIFATVYFIVATFIFYQYGLIDNELFLISNFPSANHRITLLAVVLSWTGYFVNHKWFVFISAILYCIAGMCYPLFFIALVLPIILTFVGYRNMKDFPCESTMR